MEPHPPAAEGVAPPPSLSFPRLRLLLVLVLALNVIKLQFMQLSQEYHSGISGPTARDGPRTENRTEDVAIVITSSSIPSHPSTAMVETVLNSTKRLVGLSPTAPIFITVDHFPFSDFDGTPPDLEEKIDRLEEYTINLFNRYLTDPRVHIIPAARHNHVGGSVMKAMNLISAHYPSVKWMYYLQHDYYFTTDIDHTALVDVMERHAEVNHVRFPMRPIGRFCLAGALACGDAPVVEYNSTLGEPAAKAEEGVDNNETTVAASILKLWPTPDYSDNNHLVRFEWYKRTIAALLFLERFPENPLQIWANKGCAKNQPMGLYLYHEQSIMHLDGKNGASVPTTV